MVYRKAARRGYGSVHLIIDAAWRWSRRRRFCLKSPCARRRGLGRGHAVDRWRCVLGSLPLPFGDRSELFAQAFGFQLGILCLIRQGRDVGLIAPGVFQGTAQFSADVLCRGGDGCCSCRG